MADIYVRSTDGSDADNGSTWALAKASLAGAGAIDAAGDSIYLSQVHAESTATGLWFNFAGSMASPSRVICGNDGAAPPTAVATSATVTTTGASSIQISGAAYFYGISFFCGSGFVNSQLTLNDYSLNADIQQIYEACDLIVAATGGNALINIDASTPANAALNRTLLRNCRVKTSSTSPPIIQTFGEFIWEGGSILSGQAASPALVGFSGSGRAASAHISGVDLSNMATTTSIFSVSSGTILGAVIRDCKLPASWTGTLVTGTKPAVGRLEMYNCDSGDTNYRLWIEDYAGSIVQDTGIYNDAGASDGTTRLSWKMVSAANAEYPTILLRSPEIVQWNETTGSSKTVTVEIVHNSQGSGTNGVLNDDECWLEVMYLGTAGYPLGTWVTDCKADVLATAAAQDTSSASWAGDSAGWDTQKLAVTFTPQEKGFIHARVVVAKASATVYVDPLITVS